MLGLLINIIFTIGEELEWRGLMLPKLMPLGQWKALLISGSIWGVWHAPAIAQGHNYPDHPVLGILLMTVFRILMGIVIGWIYLNTCSPWVATLVHGSINAWVIWQAFVRIGAVAMPVLVLGTIAFNLFVIILFYARSAINISHPFEYRTGERRYQ